MIATGESGNAVEAGELGSGSEGLVNVESANVVAVFELEVIVVDSDNEAFSGNMTWRLRVGAVLELSGVVVVVVAVFGWLVNELANIWGAYDAKIMNTHIFFHATYLSLVTPNNIRINTLLSFRLTAIL